MLQYCREIEPTNYTLGELHVFILYTNLFPKEPSDGLQNTIGPHFSPFDHIEQIVRQRGKTIRDYNAANLLTGDLLVTAKKLYIYKAQRFDDNKYDDKWELFILSSLYIEDLQDQIKASQAPRDHVARINRDVDKLKKELQDIAVQSQWIVEELFYNHSVSTPKHYLLRNVKQ